MELSKIYQEFSYINATQEELLKEVKLMQKSFFTEEQFQALNFNQVSTCDKTVKFFFMYILRIMIKNCSNSRSILIT